MDDYVAWTTLKESGTAVGLARRAHRERTTFRQGEGYEEVLSIARQFGHDRVPPEKRQRSELIKFVERYAPSILDLAMPASGVPLARLRKLLSKAKFATLKDITGRTVQANEEVTDLWFSALRKCRGVERDKSNYDDAVAMGYLAEANKLLEDKKVEIRLITRSSAMHIVERNSFGSSNILRHPKIFFSLMNKESHGRKLLSELESRASTLRDYVNLTTEENFRFDAPSERMKPPREDQRIAAIREYWHSVENIRLCEQTIFKFDHENPLVKELDMDFLFTIFKDDESFRSDINKRLRYLLDSIDRDHMRFGLDAYRLRVGTEGRVVFGMAKNLPVTSFRFTNLPYSIQFYAKSIRNGRDQGKSWDDVFERLLSGRSEQLASNYERKLAMAVVLGDLSNWKYAERYARNAIADTKSAVGPPPHEGYFFLSLCLRFLSPRAKRHSQGVLYIRRAAEIKAISRGDTAYRDPRYLTEEAAHIMSWHEVSASEKAGRPPLSTAGTLLEEAEQLVKDDTILRQRICNNLCCLYITCNKHMDREKGAMYLERLYSLCSKNPNKWKSFWPGLFDTLVSCTWILRRSNLNKSQWLELASDLESVQKKSTLPAHQIEILETHRKAILAGI